MPTNSPNAAAMQPLPKIIFFDIDDTLYITKESRIPDSVFAALTALKARGVLLAIATGRSFGVMPQAAMRLIETIGIDILLTMNGQYNEYQGKAWLDFAMDEAAVRHTVALCKQLNIGYACMTRDEIFAFQDTPNLQAALGALSITPQWAAVDAFDFQQKIYQMLAFVDDDQAAMLGEQLDDTLKLTRWHACAVDVLDKDASKARAIRAVLQKLNISAAEAAAFGDGLNDIQMFELVGTSIAMGNAHPALKTLATHIAPRHDEDGIWQMVRQLGWV